MKPFSVLAAGLLTVLGLTLFSRCELVEADIDQETMLDGDIIFDSSSYLVSDSFPNPSDSIKNVPVIIAAHGFTATTFEWLDFSEFRDSIYNANPDSAFLLSRVLLGGHGISYKAFKESTWEEWQAPVLEEYRNLRDLGFTRVSLAGASTGGALIAEAMARGKLAGYPPPDNIFMLDAIVVPTAKALSVIDWVGPIVGNDISEADSDEEARHWYTNRPQEALNQLLEVITRVRGQLEDGITLPEGTRLTIYKSDRDPVVDPISGLLMYKGFKASGDGDKSLEIIDSKFHVYTRSAGREDKLSARDFENQLNTFADMRTKAMGL